MADITIRVTGEQAGALPYRVDEDGTLETLQEYCQRCFNGNAAIAQRQQWQREWDALPDDRKVAILAAEAARTP